MSYRVFRNGVAATPFSNDLDLPQYSSPVLIAIRINYNF